MHPFESLQIAAGAVGIHWFGQSSFALKTADGTILHVDPYFPRQRPADRFIHTRAPLLEEALQVDGVLLTHDHGDHTCMESIDRLRAACPAVRFVAPPESTRRLTAGGIDPGAVTQVTAGDVAHLGSLRIHAVWAKPPAGHASHGIQPPDVQHLGYVVDAGGVGVYISGDPINTFADHESLLAPIRDLAPSLGLLTCHPTEGEFPFFDGSGRIAGALRLKAAVPAHYGCFVKRDYDPQAWATHLPPGVEPLIIPYNQSVVYTP